MKSGMLSAAVAACGLLLAAPVSAQGVKIGVLNHQSGIYADCGQCSFEAAQMAIEDFGGKVLGHPIEVVSADHQNKPDSAPHRAALVRHRRRRHDHRADDLVGGARGPELSKEKKKIDIVAGAATRASPARPARPTASLGLRHLRARGRHRRRDRQGRRRHLVLPHRRLRVRPSLEQDTGDVVKAGGKVLGAVRIRSTAGLLLLPAAGAELKAKIIGLANAGRDTINSIKQAAEFGIVKSGQKLAGLLLTLSEVHGLGLEAAQGLVLTEGFLLGSRRPDPRPRQALLQAHGRCRT